MSFQRQPEVLPALASDIVIDPELAHRAALTIARQDMEVTEKYMILDMLGLIEDDAEGEGEIDE